MPSAAGGHKIVARDISPCQILANVVNSIVPCTCANALCFINANTRLLPFLSPFNFWIGNNFGFILTLQKANAKLKGRNSVPSPTMQVEGRISADKSQLSYPLQICVPGGIDIGKKGGEVPSSPGKRGKQPCGRNYISALFLGFMVSHLFSSTLVLWFQKHRVTPFWELCGEVITRELC